MKCVKNSDGSFHLTVESDDKDGLTVIEMMYSIKESKMCEYCTKKGFTKSIIENGFSDVKTAVSVDIGYSDGDIKGVPAIVVCSPAGMSYSKIKFCPMCGKNLEI